VRLEGLGQLKTPLAQDNPGETEKTTINVSRPPGQERNSGPPEYVAKLNESVSYCFAKRGSSVSVAMGWRAGVRFPGGARYISLLHNLQTGYGAHPAS
jgi:hypothetical protein